MNDIFTRAASSSEVTPGDTSGWLGFGLEVLVDGAGVGAVEEVVRTLDTDTPNTDSCAGVKDILVSAASSSEVMVTEVSRSR